MSCSTDYLSSSMVFMGKFDPTKNDYKVGDLCVSDDGTVYYLNIGDNKWDEISTTYTCTYEEVEILPKICSRCGAPLRHHICEYCGTRY